MFWTSAQGINFILNGKVSHLISRRNLPLVLSKFLISTESNLDQKQRWEALTVYWQTKAPKAGDWHKQFLILISRRNLPLVLSKFLVSTESNLDQKQSWEALTVYWQTKHQRRETGTNNFVLKWPGTSNMVASFAPDCLLTLHTDNYGMAWLLTLTKSFMWLVSSIHFGLLMPLSRCKQTNHMRLTISQANDLVHVKGHTMKKKPWLTG